MPRQGGSWERTRKHRKRRGRNRQSYMATSGREESPRCRWCRIDFANVELYGAHMDAIHPKPRNDEEQAA